MTSDAIVFAGLMPHAPILARGVGAARQHAEVTHTMAAMTELARHVMSALPDTVVVISPHSPRHRGAFGIWETPLLFGSLEQFGAGDNRVSLPLDRDFADGLETEARTQGLRTWRIMDAALDHGATVPLSYLAAAGWDGPTVVLGLNEPGEGGLTAFGEAITRTAATLGRRVAIVASGDMSHRLTSTAPGGFHEDGARFDRRFIDLLQTGAGTEIDRLDASLVENAGEDVVDPTRVALAAANSAATPATVLSYEGPFGVGYGVAILAERPPVEASPAAAGPVITLSHPADLPRVARCSVEAQLEGGTRKPPFAAGGNLRHPQAVFVTLRTASGELRGCCGSSVSSQPDLVRETWQNARRAAFHDPRFAPLVRDELDEVEFSVSILGPLERVTSLAELDPDLYGVLIGTVDGRRSLLLPGIKGLESVTAQLRAAKRKGGIGIDEPIGIQRFTTQTFHEPPRTRSEPETP